MRNLPPSLGRPLGDRELAELRRFLDGTPGAMPLARAIGFLTGVVTAPTLLRPSEWHRRVFGETEFESMAEAERMFQLVTRLYNQIIAGLDAGRALMPPGGGDDALAAWCAGYIEAAQRDDVWRADEVAAMTLIPFAVIAGEIDLTGEKDTDGRVIEDPTEHVARARQLIAPGAVEIYEYWKARRAPPSAGPPRTVVRESAKVGRNEPCPCGSGKKYKRCCAVTLH